MIWKSEHQKNRLGLAGAERKGPAALCIPRSGGRPGSRRAGLCWVVASHSSRGGTSSSLWPSCPARLRVRCARRGRSGLPAEGGRMLPSAGGSGARAAREPGQPRSRSAGADAETRRSQHGRRSRHPCWEPRLPAGRWSGPRNWEPLVPALNLAVWEGALPALRPGVQPRGEAPGVQAGKQVWGEWALVLARSRGSRPRGRSC